MSKPKKIIQRMEIHYQKFNKLLEDKGIFIDDELGSKSIVKLARALNQNS